MEKVRMLMFIPNEHPKVIHIENVQNSVINVLKKHNTDCYGAHAMKIAKNMYIVYPKLSDIFEYEGTRKYKGDIICGTFLIAKTDDCGYAVSLDYGNLLKYAHEFWSNTKDSYSECIRSYFNLSYKEFDDFKI